jgi:TetR/AcrR family transcriptional regulator, regulator of mycofactocin system
MAETAPTTDPGLRERKKLRTREAIIDAALKLFEERGFEHTTIADIAEAADIAPRTFFGYFPSKEDVVFADFPEVVDRLEARLDGRPADETTIDALRAWLGELVEEKGPADERDRCRKRLIGGSETLAAHQRGLMGRIDKLLAEQIARDLDAEPDDLRPRMIASAVIGAFGALDMKGDTEPPPDPQEALAMVDEALTFLRAGMEAVRRSAG